VSGKHSVYGSALLWAALGTVSAPVSANELVFVDDFEAASLESGWSIVNENAANFSLADSPGFVRIETQRGTFGDESTVNNILLREMTGDFILDTRVAFNPQTASQFAGLVIYQDQENLVAHGLAFAEGERGEFRGVVLLNVDGSTDSDTRRPGTFYNEDSTDAPNEVFLRLLRFGDQFVGAFSSDGLTYTDVGLVTNELPDTISVGLVAANGDFAGCGTDCDVKIPADFDFFSITTLDEVPDLPDPDDAGDGSVLGIEGPDTIGAGGAIEFSALLTDAEGASTDVTASAGWLVAPDDVGTIAGGAFVAANVADATQATIVATIELEADGAPQQLTATRVVRIQPAVEGVRFCGAGMAALLPLMVIGLCRMRR